MHVIREFFLQKVLFTLEKVTIWSLWQIRRYDVVPSIMRVNAVITLIKLMLIRIHLYSKNWSLNLLESHNVQT